MCIMLQGEDDEEEEDSDFEVSESGSDESSDDVSSYSFYLLTAFVTSSSH